MDSMSVVSAMDLVLSQARVIASETRWMHVRCVEEMVLAAPAATACPTAAQCPTCVAVRTHSVCVWQERRVS